MRLRLDQCSSSFRYCAVRVLRANWRVLRWAQFRQYHPRKICHENCLGTGGARKRAPPVSREKSWQILRWWWTFWRNCPRWLKKISVSSKQFGADVSGTITSYYPTFTYAVKCGCISKEIAGLRSNGHLQTWNNWLERISLQGSSADALSPLLLVN